MTDNIASQNDSTHMVKKTRQIEEKKFLKKDNASAPAP